MTEKSKNEEYAFNAFANLPFYSTINSEFIKLAKIDDKKSIVDLGCGTGNITKLILERIRSAKDSVIYASAAAAIVVTRVGCSPAMPNYQELETFVNNNTITKFNAY